MSIFSSLPVYSVNKGEGEADAEQNVNFGLADEGKQEIPYWGHTHTQTDTI